MNDDYPSSNGSESRTWLERISSAFGGGEPRNRDELIAVLHEAHERDVIDADTLGMIEGAIEVSDGQVRDAMIPRGQMEVIPLEASREEILRSPAPAYRRARGASLPPQSTQAPQPSDHVLTLWEAGETRVSDTSLIKTGFEDV